MALFHFQAASSLYAIIFAVFFRISFLQIISMAGSWFCYTCKYLLTRRSYLQNHTSCSEIMHLSTLLFQDLQQATCEKGLTQGKGGNFLRARLIQTFSLNQVTKTTHRTDWNSKTVCRDWKTPDSFSFHHINCYLHFKKQQSLVFEDEFLSLGIFHSWSSIVFVTLAI